MPKTTRKRDFVKVGNTKIHWTRFKDGRTCLDLRKWRTSKARPTYTDHSEALREAQIFAVELNAGGADSQAITSADRASYAHAVRDVTPYGVPVHVATSEWAQARKAIGERSLSEVIAAGLRKLTRPKHPVPQVVAQMLASKAPKDLHGRYLRGLKATAEAFAQRFPGDIADVTAAEIEAYLLELNKEPRRRDNILEEIRHLFRFAWRRGYLESELTAARQVDSIDALRKPISYFTPEEIRLLLTEVSEEWQSFFLLAPFTGARPEGICVGSDAKKNRDPLRWEDFEWDAGDHGEISVRLETSKTYAHRCPILPNLWESLRPWRDRKASGKVCLGRRHDREIERILRVINRNQLKAWQARVGRTAANYFPGWAPDSEPPPEPMRWKNDGLRHSYGSYRMAILGDMGKLAYEMGNSEQMIKDNYNNPRPLNQAREYFSIVLNGLPDNVHQLAFDRPDFHVTKRDVPAGAVRLSVSNGTRAQ